MEPGPSNAIAKALRTGPVGAAFLVVMLGAEASAALPPGPDKTGLFLIGFGLLLGAVASAGWKRKGAEVADLMVPLLAIASIALLMVSVGGLATGLLSLMVLPAAWSALYLKRWHSAVVVIATGGALCGVSVAGDDYAGVVIRRVVLWLAVGALLSVATHVLRGRLDSAIHRREELLHQAQALGAAARLLNQTQDPNRVVTLAAQLAAVVGSPPGHGHRCAHYLRVEAGMVHYVGQFDERGDTWTTTWHLAEFPLVARAVRTGRPLSGAIGEIGPTVLEAFEGRGITHGAWIPVHVNGELDGILAIASRSGPLPTELFARGIELAQIVELALTNALSLQTQARLSRTDPVTGLANRRGFEAAFRSRPDETSFTILSMDLDGLKAVNDTYGHSVGDQLLVLVATTLAGALRNDDVLARIGGDEFAAVLFDASVNDAETVATRILSALSEVHLGEVEPRISIGIAVADRDADPDVVGLNADRAMYRAKRLGGMRYEFAPS